MKDIMLNTLKKISLITSSMTMPVYFGFLTTEHKSGYGDIVISSDPILEPHITHIFKLERHIGVGCELKEFMATLSLYPKSVYINNHLIDLDNLYFNLRNDGHSVISAHHELDNFLNLNAPVKEFPIQLI
ncbi:TPA: hypothetical protein GRR76_20535 [Vibrio parahaemolyticus]|nr:hypothetical protein [Vibrio parahaemolyticus]EHU5133999.1 hypothetical protein [Vibrio parahaemolyticus]HAS6469865.1 hypothetical protein [Vibrio parahaemolyticus]